MEISKTRDNVKSLIKTCEEKIKVKIKENNSSDIIQKKLTDRSFLHVSSKSMLSNNSNFYDNMIKKTKIKKVKSKNEISDTKEKNSIKNLNNVHSFENRNDDNQNDTHPTVNLDGNINYELNKKQVCSTIYEKIKNNSSNDSCKHVKKSEEKTVPYLKKKNNTSASDKSKSILNIEKNKKFSDLSYISQNPNRKLKNDVTEYFDNYNDNTILKNFDNKDNSNTCSLFNNLHTLLSDNNKVIINNSINLNKVVGTKCMYSKLTQEDSKVDVLLNNKNEDRCTNNEISDHKICIDDNNNNKSNLNIKNAIYDNENENITKFSSYIIENSFKETNKGAINNGKTILNSDDSIIKKENLNSSNDIKKNKNNVINCNNINMVSDECTSYDRNIKNEVSESTACDNTNSKNPKKEKIKKELLHKINMRNDNKRNSQKKDEKCMEFVCEYEETNKNNLIKNNTINYLNNKNSTNSNEDIITDSVKVYTPILYKEEGDEIQTYTNIKHADHINVKQEKERTKENYDYNTVNNNEMVPSKKEEEILNNSFIINNGVDAIINGKFDNMNCNQDFDNNYNEVKIENNNLLMINKCDENNNQIDDSNNNNNNIIHIKNNEISTNDYDIDIKNKNSEELIDKNFNIQKILSSCDVNETESFNLEKLKHLIIFRENAETYIQSYINSFLKDFNIMSSYLPYAHYYDKDIYKEKENNILKILSYFLENFKENEKIKKKICSFQKNFLNATMNEKIKYVDKLQLLKLSEIGTDLFKKRFFKLLKKYAERKKKKKKKIYYKLHIFNKFVKKFYKLNEKFVENNLLQIELNDLNTMVNYKKQIESCFGDVVTDNTYFEKIDKKKNIVGNNHTFCDSLIDNNINNDTLSEHISNVSTSNCEIVNSKKEKNNDITLNEILENNKIDYCIPYNQKYIFKYIHLLIENKLFNLIYTNNSKYIQNIHIKDNDVNFYNKIIINSISFYKNEIKKLFSTLIMYSIMNKSLHMMQPKLTWNINNHLHKKRCLEDVYKNGNNEDNSNKLVKHPIIRIENSFNKMVNGKNKKKKRSLFYSVIHQNEKLNSHKCEEEEIEKDIDIFINNLLVPDNSIKKDEYNTQNNENNKYNQFNILENSEEYEKHNQHVELQRKEEKLEKKEQEERQEKEKDKKLNEDEKEKEQKERELKVEQKKEHNKQELKKEQPEQQLLLREIEALDEEKKEKYKGRERKKRKNNKFKLSSDLQDIYDAYNNGEQIIIAKNKNKLLNNLEKYNNFNYLSKQTLFDAYNNMQNNIEQNGPNLNVNDVNENLRNINLLQNNCLYKNMNYTNFVNRNNNIVGLNCSSLYKYMCNRSNSYFNNDLLQKSRFDQKIGENEYYENSINSKNIDYTKYMNKLNNLSSNERNTFLSTKSSNNFIKNDNLKNMYHDFPTDNEYIYQNGIHERIKFLNDMSSKKEKYPTNSLRHVPYYTEKNNNNFLLSQLRTNIRNNMPLNGFVNYFDNNVYNLCNSMNNQLLLEKIQKENNLSNQNLSTNFTMTNNSIDSINLQAHLIDKNDLNRITNFVNCDKNMEHPNNIPNGSYMHLNRQTSDIYMNSIPNNNIINNNDFNKIKNENINNNMINSKLGIDNRGLLHGNKNSNTVDNKMITTEQNKKYSTINKNVHTKKNNNISDNNHDSNIDIINNSNINDPGNNMNNDNDNDNSTNDNNNEYSNENNNDYNRNYNSNYKNYENNIMVNEKNHVSKDIVYKGNKNILNSCINENGLSTDLSGNIIKNNISKDIIEPEGANKNLNNNHEVINNSSSNNENINMHVDTNINGFFNMNKKSENMNYNNNINRNENNKNNFNFQENNLYNFPIKNFDNFGSNSFLEDNILGKELINENKLICNIDDLDNSKNTQNTNISNINNASNINLINNNNIRENDKNIGIIKTDAINSYNNIDINVNNNDTLKFFNCTFPFLYMNNLNNTMEYTNNNNMNNINSNNNITLFPPYMSKNQVNSMFYLNNPDNANRYNINVMNSMMKPTNMYYENLKLNDKNYNILNNYNNSFNINGFLPYNSTNNDIKRYMHLGKKNNMNAYNYNINEKDNTNITNDLMNMHTNNLIDQFNYLHNYTNNNYANGYNFLNFDNARNDVGMNINMNINDYGKVFNEEDANSNVPLKNYKKKDKIKKEKKNSNGNKSACALNTTKKKRFGNTGPPSAEKLNELLHEQNLSVPQIAAIYGVHRTTVARWCHNRKIIQKSNHYQGRRRTTNKMNNNYI